MPADGTGRLVGVERLGYHAGVTVSAWRRILPLPRTLFGRAFLSILLLSLLLVGATVGWFYHRAYQRLDREAADRLLAGARLLAAELVDLQAAEDLPAAHRLLERRFGAGQTLGWIQNVWWVDMGATPTRFLASFSIEAGPRDSLLPPSLDEVEDQIYDGINSLDRGRPYFPDPFAQSSSRRFKSILWPVLDGEGFLDSVIGLEADLEYLDLSIATRQTALWAMILSVPLCLAASWWLAGGFTRRIGLLLEDLGRLERREPVPAEDLGIRELDVLRRGLADLGRRIDQRDRHIQEVHAEKLQELSLLGGAIAHEIRNPLSAIEMHLGLLRRRLGATPEESEPVREIQQQLAAMKTLVNRFLSYSRRVVPQVGPIDLQTLVGQVMEGAARVGTPFGWSWQGPPAVTVTGDATLLAQVFDNLVTNARAARPDGLQLTVSVERDGGLVRLAVTDNGPGVPDGLAGRLFTPFVSGRPDGFGIGLALSRKLVEAHNGRLLFRPASDGGACFLIELPEHPEP